MQEEQNTGAEIGGEPRAEYRRRLALRQSAAERLEHRDRSISNWRGLVFALGAIVAGLNWRFGLFSNWWLVVPVGMFLALAAFHDRVIQAHRRAQRAVAFYKVGLWRIEGRWQGNGVTGARFQDAKHPYATDLDLFGHGSLYEMLCTARTQSGEERIAAWLCSSSPPEEVRARQEAVRDLRTRIDLREDLAMLGEQVRTAISVGDLADWGKMPIVFLDRRMGIVAVCLVICVLIGLTIWAAHISPIPFFALLAIEQFYTWRLRGRVRSVTRSVEKPTREIEILGKLLARLEQETYNSPRLRELQEVLIRDGKPASGRIFRLQRLVELLEVPHSTLLKPLCSLLLWTPFCAFAIDRWRAGSGQQIGPWLQAIGDFEALCALSGYAYEHPEDIFPEFVESGPMYEAEGMTHPLLPTEHAVRNTLRLDKDLRMLMVSGSNMSGKSTLLRAIGANIVLARMGAPVRARSMRLSHLSLGTSISTQDSIQEGVSRFYAEILRLRQIVDLASGEPPLVFLLDEILHGTNSHDRRLGAEAVLRSLIARGAIGLVTTHDLALARIAEDPELHTVNVHFEDRIADGKISFDYTLREGIVTKSNAIELMRAVGLDV